MKFLKKVQERSETVLFDVAMHGAKERFKEGGYPALADMAFEQVGIRPVYIAESRPEFNAWRNKLRTESGVVIANHPGAIDVPAVVKTLDRKDVYFIAAEKNVDRMKGIVGEEYLLPAAKDLGQLRVMLRRVEKALVKGGIVFLFPTGGSDIDGRPVEFKSGFAHILKMLKPEQMVYAFNISLEDMRRAIPGTPSGARVGSEMIAGKLGMKPSKDKWPTVRIDERYTTADAWLELVRPIPGSQTTKNERLANQYVQLFKEMT
jgi:hypothetical protein